jgi:hypothetical protein
MHCARRPHRRMRRAATKRERKELESPPSLLDQADVDSPDNTIGFGVLKRGIRSHIYGVSKVEQSRGSAVMLHQR